MCYIYLKCIWCSGFPKIYAQLEEGVGSICHGYMCIVLYVILIWCSGIPEIHGHLEEGGGQNLVGVVVFHRSIITWGRSSEGTPHLEI